MALVEMVRVQYDIFPPNFFRSAEEAGEHIEQSNELNPHHDPKGWKVDIVQREPRTCRFCPKQIESDNPDCDFCRDCFYQGRVYEDGVTTLVEALKETGLFNVDSVGVWHTGGGCFAVGATLATDEAVCALMSADNSVDEGPSLGVPWGVSMDRDGEEFLNGFDPFGEYASCFSVEALVERVVSLVARWNAGERDG